MDEDPPNSPSAADEPDPVSRARLRSRALAPRTILRRIVRVLPITSAVAGLAAGALAAAAGHPALATLLWAAGAGPGFVVCLADIVASLRRGKVGLDIVAALAMGASLAIGETLAASVVALMYASGRALEAFAEGRASRDMNALLMRVPKTAARYADAAIETVPVDAIVAGDRLLVRLGDVLPVDGTVCGQALLDQSALTGEALPVTKRNGDAAMSGSTVLGASFDLIASETAARSTYSGIVRLVEAATRSQAPMTRLADRYALGFTAATVLVSAAAWWLSGDPVRAVAVLVVATPCPLILAVPVAIVAGLSRAARAGVLVKGGAALETLGRIRTLVIDKTGTLTYGAAAVAEIVPMKDWTSAEVLRLAASLDQASRHAVATAIVEAALERRLVLERPRDAREVPGEGVEGRVGGRLIRVGGASFVSKGLPDGDRSALAAAIPEGALTVALSVDGELAGLVLLRDGLRADAAATLSRLRGLGLTRIVLATGDRRDVALAVTKELRLDEIRCDLAPSEKIALVQREKLSAPVMMVGDGVNDAPALVEADLGIAMGARGAAASAEAADIILLRDSLHGLGTVIAIGRRARRIALQSVVAGLGLSGLAMAVAAFGYLPPVQGAFLQEAIDVAVILNALRALGPGGLETGSPDGAATAASGPANGASSASNPS